MLATDQNVSLKRTKDVENVPESKRLKTTDQTKVKKGAETILINPELEEQIHVDVERRDILASPANLIRTFKSDKFSLVSPDVFSFSKCGQIPHVTADLCTEDVVGDVKIISLHSVLTTPGTKILQKLNKSLSEYMNCKNTLIISPFDNLDPHDLTNYNDQLSISVWNKAGRKKLTPKEYFSFIKVSKPEMFITLADIVPGSTVSLKRANKSCYRTLNWVNEAVTFLSENPDVPSKLLAVLPGCGYRQLMLKSAKILANRDVFGYVIERSTLPKSGWDELVKDVISILPHSKPVIMLGVLNSLEMSRAYNCGCHFVDSSFVLPYSNEGHALAFDVLNPAKLTTIVPQSVSETSESVNCSDFGPSLMAVGSDQKDEPDNVGYKKKEKQGKHTGKTPIYTITDYIPNSHISLNLKDTSFSKQFVPLLETCTCFSCTRHTRGYVNHLLVTKELLAPTLLMLHNLHHIRLLLNVVKEKVQTGSGLTELVGKLASVFEKS